MLNLGKNKKRFEAKNVLIIKLDAAGDMLMATPVFGLLKERYPNCKISVWCKPLAAEIIIHNPNVDETFIKKTALKSQFFDLIIDLRGNWQSVWFAFTHRPKLRLDRGTIRFKNMLLGNHPHDTETNYQIVQPLLKTKKPDLQPVIFYSIKDAEAVQTYLGAKQVKQFVVLHTSAKTPLRKWPVNNYVALIHFLKEKFNCTILLAGGKEEEAENQRLAAVFKDNVAVIAGKFNFSAYAALVEKAFMFIGNESAPMHIAAAMQVPTIGLFGPGEPVVFYPKGKKTAFIHHVLPCNPCNQQHCVRPEEPCMNLILLEEVIEKINNFSANVTGVLSV